jgi:Amt family ammonium transporter
MGPHGYDGLLPTGNGYDAGAIVLFLFMMIFMDTTATIVTGACAERWSFKSFCIFSVIVGASSTRSSDAGCGAAGWLAQLGYRAGLGHGAVDYAGSGVVHLQGGALALITAVPHRAAHRQVRRRRQGQPDPRRTTSPWCSSARSSSPSAGSASTPGSSLAGADGRIGIVAANTMIAGMSATALGRALHVDALRKARSRA